MYAVKLLDATMGKFIAAAAGIEGRDGLPVARQSPPQYGRSFAGMVVSMLNDFEDANRRGQLTSSNDEHWSSIGVLHRPTSQCQQLAKRDRLLGVLAHEQETRIEEAWQGKQVLICANVGIRQVSRRVVQTR